jgi:hypothetical protein
MFHDPAAFPVVQHFQSHWKQIRAEYERLDPRIIDVHRNGTHEEYIAQIVENNGWVPSWQVGTSEKNDGWLTYGISVAGRFTNEAPRKYPFLQSLLKDFPQVTACAFSKMKALTFIAPHEHVELGGPILTCHLGIDLSPGYSYLNVDGVMCEEREGGALVFDGSSTHFAINMSDRDRVVLSRAPWNNETNRYKYFFTKRTNRSRLLLIYRETLQHIDKSLRCRATETHEQDPRVQP